MEEAQSRQRTVKVSLILNEWFDPNLLAFVLQVCEEGGYNDGMQFAVKIGFCWFVHINT